LEDLNSRFAVELRLIFPWLSRAQDEHFAYDPPEDFVSAGAAASKTATSGTMKLFNMGD
jgi:hypothetical protein